MALVRFQLVGGEMADGAKSATAREAEMPYFTAKVEVPDDTRIICAVAVRW